MFTQTGLCFILIIIIYFNTASSIPSTTRNIEDQDEKRSSIAVSEQFDSDPDYLLANHPLYDNDDDDDVNNDGMYYQKKRSIMKKWYEFFQRPNSPYTIAFPALLRSRR
ncbi:unnamed protein product [Adineta steineri]|uniref:Secreted protein n=1 Tax=Adineta steineri TaxID=433720 RepID=A0A813ZH73_9BILA|nr:unnamed protein product [Adineta steineri]CAF0902020.1 unnamed protein product [Adineta steineri]CAF0928750.1 unnamed protein product [Adineta steineri]